MGTKVVCYDIKTKACIHSYNVERQPVIKDGESFNVPHFEKGKDEYQVAYSKLNETNGEYQVFLKKIPGPIDNKPMGEAPKITKDQLNGDKKIEEDKPIDSIKKKCNQFFGMSLMSMVISLLIELIVSVVLFTYSPIISICFGFLCSLFFVGYVVYHNIQKNNILEKLSSLREYVCT